MNIAEVDRLAAAEEAAAESAAMHFADPEALAKAMELVGLEDEDLLLEAQAICAMWHATQATYPTAIKKFEAEAMGALRKFTEAVFARISAYELELG